MVWYLIAYAAGAASVIAFNRYWPTTIKPELQKEVKAAEDKIKSKL